MKRKGFVFVGLWCPEKDHVAMTEHVFNQELLFCGKSRRSVTEFVISAIRERLGRLRRQREHMQRKRLERKEKRVQAGAESDSRGSRRTKSL